LFHSKEDALWAFISVVESELKTKQRTIKVYFMIIKSISNIAIVFVKWCYSCGQSC
jgi:hypothetical protein